MKGSEKQVKWASEIISAADKAWDDLKSGVKPEAQEKFEAMKQDFFARMKTDLAEVVIANKHNFPEDAAALKTNFGFFSKVKISI